MSDHPFTITVGDAETTGRCLFWGAGLRVAEGSKKCRLPKHSKRHAGRPTVYLPAQVEQVEEPEDDLSDLDDEQFRCPNEPCGFYTGVAEKLREHSDAHAHFVKEAPESPFLLKPFDGEAALAILCHSEKVLELVRQKDRAYGGAWKAQGYMGNLARIQSKTERLKNMTWRDRAEGDFSTEEDEPIEDSLRDLMALCAFALANLEEGNRWGR